MIEITFAPTFLKQFGKLQKEIKEEVIEKVELFKNRQNHTSLKVHKLHGRLADKMSFSVNYKIRIVYTISKNEACFLSVGSHDIYN